MPSKMKHFFQGRKLCVTGEMQNDMFLRLYTHPDIIYSPILFLITIVVSAFKGFLILVFVSGKLIS